MAAVFDKKGTWIRIRPPMAAWLVLLVGIPVSLFSFWLVKDSIERVASLRFEREAIAASGIVETHFASYTQVLFALRALFASEAFVDRRRFHRFVESIDLGRRFPGIISLNYAAYVSGKAKTDVEKEVRTDTSLSPDGYPKFSIKPSGDRSEYFVLLYLEPMEGYESVFGLDLGKSPVAQDANKVARALQFGRDSGQLTASAQPLRGIRATGGIYLAMRLAVYQSGMPVATVEQRRIAYLGSVGAGFSIEKVVEVALGKKLPPHVRVRLYDMGFATQHPDSASSSGEQSLLFDSKPLSQHAVDSTANAYAESVFVHRVPLVVAGRKWEVEFSAPALAEVSHLDRSLPALVLIGGLLLTLLLFGVVYTLSTSRSRAIAMADEITKDLRDNEAVLAEAQHMAQLGSWTLDPATGAMTCSEEVYRILGLQEKPTLETFSEALQFIYAEDRERAEKALRIAASSGHGSDTMHRILRRNGATRWVRTIIKPARLNSHAKVLGVIMDITERRLADRKLEKSRSQLQALSRRLVDAQEVERRRFSAELHDVVGQNLTALSFNLDILATQLSGNENNAVTLRLADSATLVRSTADVVDNVLAELRPPMLDDYGLIAALQWYAEQFSARTNIQTVVCGDESMARLSPVAEIGLFRVAQEALNNIAKHACAKCVEIRLERTASQYVMSVSDDGTGFDVVSRATPRRRDKSNMVAVPERRRESLGMVTMRERVQALGGTFEIQSTPGFGTRVKFLVPFKLI
jgi:PAS domain S-box-containing protein